MTTQRINENADKKQDFSERMNRGYEINGQWYFELRGGGQKGPYDTQDEMTKQLNEFIQLHHE